jgi:hypothetical protein
MMTTAPDATFPLVSAAILVGSGLLLTVLRETGKVSMKFVSGAIVGLAVVGFVVMGIHYSPESPVAGAVLLLTIGLVVLLVAGLVYYVVFSLVARKSPFVWWREEDERLRKRTATRRQST